MSTSSPHAVSMPVPAIDEREGRAWRTLALLLFVCGAWMVRYRYIGIAHDCVLYTLFALARLHPQLLSSDIFLRFGSQDQYTIFSPMYARAIESLGLEPAAALLTFLTLACLFGFAWLFATRFMPPRAALLALGLYIVLPSDYGAGGIFHSIEGFLTPRLPAEALVVVGIAAAVRERHFVAVLCFVAAMFLHPIMGSAGIAWLLCLAIAIPRPRVTALLGAAGLLGSTLLIVFTGGMLLRRFDPAWLHIVSADSPFLFPSSWSLHDWSCAIVPFAMLAVGCLATSEELVRKVCAASLVASVAGVALTLLYCDLLHTLIVTEMQPWRWLWLTNAIAVLLSPRLARDCWRGGAYARSAVLLLIGAWITRGEALGLVLAGAAVSCASLRRSRALESSARIFLHGSWTLLIAIALVHVVEQMSFVQINSYGGESLPGALLFWVQSHPGNDLWCAAALAMLWCLTERVQSRHMAASLALLAALGCGFLAPSVWHAWTDFQYPEALRARLGVWRKAIPPGAEVMWPATPVGAWYLLERPSYWSIYQLAGDIFSRGKSVVLQRRERTLEMGWLTPEAAADHFRRSAKPASVSSGKSASVPLALIDRLSARGLSVACRDPDLRYFVTWNPIARTPFPPIAPDPAKPTSRLYLFRCSDFKG